MFLTKFIPYVKIVCLIGVVAAIFLGYTHYKGLLEENATLSDNNSKLKVAVDEQRRATEAALGNIEQWQSTLKGYRDTLERLQAVQERSSRETRRLHALFSEHDLEALARRKPGLVERRLNSGSDAARRMLECASTGDPGCPDPASHSP